MADFVHLHLHTTYSLQDGQCQLVPLVKRARSLGMGALAVTDHGNLFAAKAFYDECRSTEEKKYGELAGKPVKPIIGCEAYIVNGDYRERVKRDRFHLCLHAKNLAGYRNLVKLVSEAHVNGFYYKPCIDHALLEKYHEGLHVSSACLAGEVARAITDGRMDAAEKIAAYYKELFGDDFSLEVMEHRSTVHPAMNTGPRGVWKRQAEVTKGVVELAKKLSIRVIATNDVHFLDKEDNDSHDVLLALSHGKKMSDPPRIDDFDDGAVKGGRLVYTGEEWFKPAEEMAKIFPEHPEFLRNTVEVAERIEEYDLNSPPIMPKFRIPAEFGTEKEYAAKYGEDELKVEFPRYDKLGGYEKVLRIKLEADYLAHLAREGARRRWGDPLPPETEERLDLELKTIREMGFPGYFLIVQDYIAAAREKLGVWVGPGRGSAAGSAVAYALGITNVDPLRFDLLFERFLNPDRVSMPDIDVDFDDEGRAKVLQYVVDTYGADHVAHIVAFGQMGGKVSIKDVGRVMEYPLADTAKLASYVPATPKISFSRAREESPELDAAFKSPDPVVHKLMERAARLEGCVRQLSIHACGIIISRDPLVETIPVMPSPDQKEKLITTQYDGHFVESVGLLKMDFLGLKTLTVEKECVALVKKFRGIDIDPDKLPDDDRETYELFGRGETTGLFQFESDGMKRYLMDLQPDRLEDLVAMNALYRPGPLANIPTYIARKHGKEPIAYEHPLMAKCLKETYGVTVYQEQVMLLSRLLGGFTRGMSDTLRKAMGKKIPDLMQKLYVEFEKGCLANKEFRVGKWADEKEARALIGKIWGEWKEFAKYAFNKSHAVCYAWIAYQTGYLKAHFPVEFMCAQISSEIGKFEKLPGIVAEAAAMGIEVRLPDVNKAFAAFSPVAGEKAIWYGLAGIKGVGAGAAEAIVQERERNGPYKGLADFAIRLMSAAAEAPAGPDGRKPAPALNKRVLENLVRAGAFDSFIAADGGMHRARYFHNVDAVLKTANARAAEKARGQTDFFAALSCDNDASDSSLPDCPRFPPHELYKGEKELLGMYMTGHPLGPFRFALRALSTVSAGALPEIPFMEEAGAERPLRVPVRLAGMLKSCQTKMSKPKKPGDLPQPWAILAIDDGENEIEALAFSKTFAKYKDWLPDEVERPVLVCGELSHRIGRESRVEEDEIQFVVREAYPLETGISVFSKAIVFPVHCGPDAPEYVKRIAKLAARFPGTLPARLEVAYPDGRIAELSLPGGVSPSSDFFSALTMEIKSAPYRLETSSVIFAEPPPDRQWGKRR